MEKRTITGQISDAALPMDILPMCRFSDDFSSTRKEELKEMASELERESKKGGLEMNVDREDKNY